MLHILRPCSSPGSGFTTCPSFPSKLIPDGGAEVPRPSREKQSSVAVLLFCFPQLLADCDPSPGGPGAPGDLRAGRPGRGPGLHGRPVPRRAAVAVGRASPASFSQPALPAPAETFHITSPPLTICNDDKSSYLALKQSACTQYKHRHRQGYSHEISRVSTPHACSGPLHALRWEPGGLSPRPSFP